MRRILFLLVFLASPVVVLAQNLNGAWVTPDGREVQVNGQQWAYYENGQLYDHGILQYDDRQIVTRSAVNGMQVLYGYSFMQGYLFLQEQNGTIHRYQRKSQGGGGGNDAYNREIEACKRLAFEDVALCMDKVASKYGRL
ncbi:hypothetical protein QO034_03415 [Sedimentitalea sp. JM2-8]|uniref:MORN repeat variant n=1 Tax=Sedimentitalea xiamensis TaxID=3050037 RepID=A0ABT7FAL5_9RHOB|nr:hypothetical protein [Sedimentitalea xiamensis]MDK3072148.1 hypothetical protein [Sedimentitalea xiamensis]